MAASVPEGPGPRRAGYPFAPPGALPNTSLIFSSWSTLSLGSTDCEITLLSCFGSSTSLLSISMLNRPSAARVCWACWGCWPTTLGISTLLPLDTWMVISVPGCTLVPAGGSVLSTSPSSALPSTCSACWLTLRPAWNSWLAAACRFEPFRSGTTIEVCLAPTTMLTFEPPSTFSPGPGSVLVTLPTWVESVVSWVVVVPSTRPTALSSSPTLSGSSPVSFGTVTSAGPLPTDRLTVARSATWVPGGGSVLMILPVWSTVDSTWLTWPTRRPAWVIWLRASCSTRPVSVAGTATVFGAAGGDSST